MRFVYGIVRALFFAVIIIGLPMLLVRYGSPLPDHFPRGEDWRVLVTAPDENTLADIIVIAAWIAWAVVILAIVARIVRLAREEPAPTAPAERWHVPGPVRAISAVLLGTAATTAVAGTLTAPAQAAPTSDSPPQTGTVSGESAQPAVAYTVRKDDTLWDIADRQLHNPLRWKEIYELNENRPQPDGGRLTQAALIRPGWILHLPGAVDSPPNPPAPTTPDTPSSPPSPPSDTTPPTTPPTTSSGSAQPDETSTASDTPYPQPADGGFRLPTGAWIAAGLATAVAGSVTLARARRRRRATPEAPAPTTRIPPKVASVLDAAAEAPADAEPTAAGIDGEHAAVTVGALPNGGIGLTGPGAHAVARALIAAHLADAEGEVFISHDDLAHLLPEHLDPQQIPARVTIPAATADTANVLHTRILARLRDFDTHNDQPGRLLVVTSDPPAAERAADHTELDITTVVLGPWPNATVTVDADGHVTDTTSAQDTVLELTRFHHMIDADLAGILATFADTATTKHPAAEPEPVAEPAAVDTPETTSPAPPDTCEPVGALVDISVFGPITVIADGTAIATGLRTKTRELLAYLAWAHPHGASPATLTEELLPDITMSKAGNYLRTLVANARGTLREASDQADETFVTTTTDRHGLDPAAVDSDLWRFHTHLNTAAGTTDPAEEAAHLTAATALYQGDFATGCDGEWAEPVREDLRHRTVNALIRLAELHDDDNPKAAITSLETACRLDPLNETLHQRTITAYLAVGRLDTALRLFRTFKTALRDIDEEPNQATYGLFNENPLKAPLI